MALIKLLAVVRPNPWRECDNVTVMQISKKQRRTPVNRTLRDTSSIIVKASGARTVIVVDVCYCQEYMGRTRHLTMSMSDVHGGNQPRHHHHHSSEPMLILLIGKNKIRENERACRKKSQMKIKNRERRRHNAEIWSLRSNLIATYRHFSRTWFSVLQLQWLKSEPQWNEIRFGDPVRPNRIRQPPPWRRWWWNTLISKWKRKISFCSLEYLPVRVFSSSSSSRKKKFGKSL